jgi:hypothetical protein
MSEMVERVTKAVRNAREMSLCGLCDRGYRRLTRCSCEEIARAVIEAMREPTERMLDSGACYEDQDHRFIAEGDISRDIWRAMIDSALQPATDTGEAK